MMESIYWTAVFLVIYTYVLYPAVLFFIHAFSRKKLVAEILVPPPVSVVIAAYNEEDAIAAKIKNLAAIDYPKEHIEILVGSDGSDDATVRVLKEAKLESIKIFDFKDRRGKIGVLKDIVSEAKGEILIFSDANTIYEPDAVKRLVAHFSDLAVGCVCGRLKLNSSNGAKEGDYEGIYWRYESAIKRMEGELGAVLGANGGIYAIRKELFPEIPNDTIVEDFVIPMKILERGYKTLYEKDAVAYEDSSKTIADESSRKIRIGAGAYQTLFLTLPMLNIFRGFPSFAYWSHKVIRWFVPFLMIVILGTNILLVHIPPYKYLLIGQALFYSGAVVGYLISKSWVHNRLFTLLYYFVAMNVSLLLGFFRFISGRQQVMWKRVER